MVGFLLQFWIVLILESQILEEFFNLNIIQCNFILLENKNSNKCKKITSISQHMIILLYLDSIINMIFRYLFYFIGCLISYYIVKKWYFKFNLKIKVSLIIQPFFEIYYIIFYRYRYLSWKKCWQCIFVFIQMEINRLSSIDSIKTNWSRVWNHTYNNKST